MNKAPRLGQVRELPGGLVLELRAGNNPALVLVKGDDTIRAERSTVTSMVAALVDVVADLLRCWPAVGCIMPDLMSWLLGRDERCI